MIRIEFDADLKGAFSQIGLISKESMIEQSSKAGNKVRVNSRKSYLASSTDFTQDYKKNKKGIKTRRIKSRGNSLAQTLGIKIAHRNGGGFDNPKNMANHITAKTSEATGTTVVGGGHKAFTPKTIRDGKIVSTQKKVGRVDKRTLAILDKHNDGAVLPGVRKYLRWRNKDGGYSKDSIPEFNNKWKARHFMEKGYSMSRGYIKSNLTTELERLIGKRVNNMKTKGKSNVA